MEKNNYFIYKITNQINNKVYIGQTKGSVKRRFSAHKRLDNPCTALRNAMNKYGRDNFTIETVDTAISKDELNNKEIYWINEYKSNNRNYGYNIAGGGKATSKLKPVICLSNNKKYNSIIECANDLNADPKMIGEVCRGNKCSHKGLKFAYLDKNNNPILNILRNAKPIKKVMCYETGIIYGSCIKASKELGLSRNAISEVAYGRTPTANGYHFFFVDEENKPIINNKILNRRARTVRVQCVETKEIYNSFVEASNITGISKECLHQAVRKGCKASGYHWIKYKEAI